jgi:hypothetical protein
LITARTDRGDVTEDGSTPADDRTRRGDGGTEDALSERTRRYRVLFLLAVAELLAMTLWFSASAVGPELAAAWGLTAAETAWLTNAVQLGFVWGFVIVADSAQFSTAVSELADDSYVGTAAMLYLRRLPESRQLAGGAG